MRITINICKTFFSRIFRFCWFLFLVKAIQSTKIFCLLQINIIINISIYRIWIRKSNAIEHKSFYFFTFVFVLLLSFCWRLCIFYLCSHNNNIFWEDDSADPINDKYWQICKLIVIKSVCIEAILWWGIRKKGKFRWKDAIFEK